jgi:AraC-like DNA-binding protein
MTRFQFESWSIEDLAGYERGRQVEFDPLFPFSIKLFEYDLNPSPLLNRHEHLEVFVPCGGHGTFAMGSRVLPFAAGDVLIVENLKPHGIQQFHGECPRGMVIAFPPEFVCGPDALPCDSGFLAPFYRQGAARQPILKADDPQASNVHSALIRLANCYTESARNLRLQSGCKVYLLELLYLLAARLDRPRFMQPESVLHQEESGQLDKLYRFLFANLSERITVADAASMLNMSESKFMKYFKRATGETFVSHLTRLRLERASDLLRRTNLPVAEISYSVGFADQSYFDRVFRRQFSRTPREVRRGHTEKAPIAPSYRTTAHDTAVLG